MTSEPTQSNNFIAVADPGMDWNWYSYGTSWANATYPSFRERFVDQINEISEEQLRQVQDRVRESISRSTEREFTNQLTELSIDHLRRRNQEPRDEGVTWRTVTRSTTDFTYQAPPRGFSFTYNGHLINEPEHFDPNWEQKVADYEAWLNSDEE